MGYLAEIFWKNKIVCCYVKEKKDKKLRIVLPTLKEELINASDLVYLDNLKVSTNDIQQILLEKNELREKLKENFNLEEIWEILEEEEYNAKEISDLYLGKESTDDEVAAFLRKIFETKNYFSITKMGTILRLSEKQVREIQNKKQKQEEKELKLLEFEKVLEKFFNGCIQNLTDSESYWIDKLKRYVIFDECKDRNIIEEVLKKKGISNIYYLFKFLVENGMVEEDLFFEISRTKFPNFSLEDKKEAEILINKGILFENRVDLTNLYTFTIDSEDTKDFDDAISVEFMHDKVILYIHISDVASFIDHNSSLFNTALKRMQTLYLPDFIMPMLPEDITFKKFSLVKNDPKNAVTFLFEIDKNTYEILKFDIFLSVIKVDENMVYEDIDERIGSGDGFWKDLYEILRANKDRRLQNGAFSIFLPEVLVKIDPKGNLVLKRIEMTKSRDLISEAMILVNTFVAKFLADNKVPCIFRFQREPNKIIEINSIVDVFNQLKYFNKVEFSLIPRFHSGLGVEQYVTITSPIRRFLDLLCQYQLICFLQNKQFLAESDLIKLLPEIENYLSRAQLLQTRRNKYFLLKYLSMQKGEKFEGIVINNGKIYLPDFNYIAVFKEPRQFKTGQNVLVRIKYVDPYLEYLEVEPFV